MTQTYKERVEALQYGYTDVHTVRSYMDGHDDATTAAAELAAEADASLASNDAEIARLREEVELARKLHWLAARDHVFFASYNEEINDWDDGAHPAINCNDIFVPGADAEGLRIEEVDAYLSLCRKYPDDADAAWCAAKRNTKPWRNYVINEQAKSEAETLIAAISASKKG